MSDRTQSTHPSQAQNTNTATQRSAATREEFSNAMSGVSWWATSTEQEQVALWEIHTESGELLADFAILAHEYASAAELLDDDGGVDESTDDIPETAEQVAAEQATPPVVATPEVVPTHTLEQANSTLKRFGKHLEATEQSNYTTAALAAQYVEEFLGVAPGSATRSTAVERLAGEWLLWDAESMSIPQSKAMTTLRARVNVLLRTNAVVALMGDGSAVPMDKGKGKVKGRDSKGRLVWGKLREFSPLVERNASDHVESWHIQPHVAEEAKVLLVEVTDSNMDRADVVKKVLVLVEKEQAARLAEARAQQEATVLDATVQREAEMVARKAAADAKRVADTAVEAAKDGTAETADAAAKALATLREEQEKAKAASAVAELAAKRAAQQEREAVEASRKQAEANGKRAAKDAKRAERGEKTATVAAPPTPTANQGTNLLAQAQHMGNLGTTKDIAGFMVDMTTGSDTPDDVLEAYLTAMDGHKELSKVSQRAIKDALGRIRVGNRTPAEIEASRTAKEAPRATVVVPAAVNGELVAA